MDETARRATRPTGNENPAAQERPAGTPDAASGAPQDDGAALRRSEEFQGLAIEAGGVGLWGLDRLTQELIVSPQMARLLGFPEHTRVLPEAAWREAVAPEYRELLAAALAAAVQRDVPFEMELPVVPPGGGERWLYARGRTVRDAAGRPLRVCGTAVDISGRKHWERRLRDSETQFRALFEVTSVGMGQSEPLTGRILRVNEKLAQMLGCTRAELLGRSFLELTHPEDREPNCAAFRDLVEGRRPALEVEKRLLRADGRALWVSMSVNLIRDAQGAPLRTFAVVRDIDARKAAEEALRRAHDELEARVRERTAALQAEVAERRGAERRVRELHDTLGQHLTVLSLGLKAVGELDGCPSPVHQRLAHVRQAAQGLEAAVDRLAHEMRPPSLDDLGLEDALRQHAEAWSAEGGIEVEFHSHGLGGQRLPTEVETTAYRVVQEALTNVRRHAGAGRVALLVERRAAELRVLVEDDGQGFDTASVPRRAGRHRLGLSGMQERAALAGGRLEIESTPGFGTTVYLTVPLAPDPGEDGA